MGFICELYNFITSDRGQLTSSLVALSAFGYTIGKDIILMLIEFFRKFKSKPRLDFHELSFIITIPLSHKREFIITEPPKISFVDGYKLFNRIWWNRKQTLKKYSYENKFNTLNTKTSIHIFKFQLTFSDFLNFEFDTLPYLVVQFKIEGDKSITKIFKTRKLLKESKYEYEEFKIKTINRQKELINFQSTISTEERFKLFNQELPTRETDEEFILNDGQYELTEDDKWVDNKGYFFEETEHDKIINELREKLSKPLEISF